MDPVMPTRQNPVLPDLPQTPVPEMHSSRRWFWMILMVLLLLLVIVSLVFVVMPKKVHAPTVTPAPAQTTGGVPQATKTLDLAPSVPSNQKTVLTIENSDSSLEKVILPTTQVAAYIQTLPQGTRVVSQNPAQ